MLASMMLLPVASAAPLLGGVGSLLGLGSHTSTSASASVSSDIEVFASAFVNSYTGGAYNTCGNNLGGFDLLGSGSLHLSLDVVTSTCTNFNTWIGGQCFGHYNDHALCTELSAYLTATWYAYVHGWAGDHFFACLGETRINRWHDLLGGLCGYSTCPQQGCHGITSEWGAFLSTYTHLDASAYAGLVTDFTNAGIFALIDASANLWSGTVVHTRGLEVAAEELA